jgi:predicted lactoylglutathione lyase
VEIRRLDHVALLVRDVERSRRFYIQLPGMEEHPCPRDEGVMQLYICDPDGYIVEFFVWQK